jgi:UDP-N-acetylmuramate--alanine ligase
MKPLFRTFSRVHLVGIGGAGMSGLAYVLRELGCSISGSDRSSSRVVAQLRRDGIEVHVGHRDALVRGTDLVVYSAAIMDSNEELVEARRLSIPTIGRAEVLGELTRSYFTIGVAGTHGKTTTASMVASIFKQGGLGPSILIGGSVQGRIQAELGEGELFVVEADEFDRSFLYLYPSAAIVTTIDAEHLDCYRDLNEVQDAFCQYLGRLPFYGHSLLGGDDPDVRDILKGLDRGYFTFGLASQNDFRAENIQRRAWGCFFDLFFRREHLGRIEVGIPGEHNVRNALAAAGMAHSLGIEFAPIEAGLRTFVGVERRFEKRGEVEDILVIDDYAHHPVEVAAALATARDSGRRVVAVFQPHLYSRTRDFMEDFAHSLQAADQVFLADIYGSREEPLPGVHASLIAGVMREQGYDQVEYVPDMEQVKSRLLETCRAGDLVVTLGAGDIDRVADEFLAALNARTG